MKRFSSGKLIIMREDVWQLVMMPYLHKRSANFLILYNQEVGAFLFCRKNNLKYLICTLFAILFWGNTVLATKCLNKVATIGESGFLTDIIQVQIRKK